MYLRTATVDPDLIVLVTLVLIVFPPYFFIEHQSTKYKFWIYYFITALKLRKKQNYYFQEAEL